MSRSFKEKRTYGILALSLFVFTGTYNAIVINAESRISSSDVRFVKRLDELYSINTPGRQVAASIKWQKLASKEDIQKKKVVVVEQQIKKTDSSPAREEIPTASIQEELSLSLVEVVNPKKWQQGLKLDQFSGDLVTNNGVIESLNVSLPNEEGVSLSFTEMSGNVFEYDLNGELYSGMMYQVDQKSYMVTMTNGPLEGTRLRFSSEATPEAQQQSQEYLAENHNVQAGNFGQENGQAQAEVHPGLQPEVQDPQVQAEEQQPVQQDEVAQADKSMQEEAMQAQSFNMEHSSGSANTYEQVL